MTQTQPKDKTATAPAEARSAGEVAVLSPPRLPYHDLIKDRFGFDRAEWKALVEAVWPGAKTPDAVALALSYCKARKLDPFKRVVHIVPIWDRDLETFDERTGKQRKGGYRETVWPGIAEHRTTAARTKQYAGADAAVFGPEKTQEFTYASDDGSEARRVVVTFPEWCQLTIYRVVGGQRCPFPGPRVYWLETYSKIGKSLMPNDRWQRSPYQMIEKCAEAAALRRAFPEEIGDEATVEEIGAYQDHGGDQRPALPPRHDAVHAEPPADASAADEPMDPFMLPAITIGEHDLSFDTPEAAVEAATKSISMAEKHGTTDMLATVWEESVSVLAADLRNRGFGDMADLLQKLEGEAHARMVEKSSAAATPPATAAPEAAPPKGDKRKAKAEAGPATEPPAVSKEPPNPFTKRGSEWAPWVKWFIEERLGKTAAEERPALREPHKRELNFVQAYRAADWAEIVKLVPAWGLKP